MNFLRIKIIVIFEDLSLKSFLCLLRSKLPWKMNLLILNSMSHGSGAGVPYSVVLDWRWAGAARGRSSAATTSVNYNRLYNCHTRTLEPEKNLLFKKTRGSDSISAICVGSSAPLLFFKDRRRTTERIKETERFLAQALTTFLFLENLRELRMIIRFWRIAGGRGPGRFPTRTFFPFGSVGSSPTGSWADQPQGDSCDHHHTLSWCRMAQHRHQATHYDSASFIQK